MPASPTTYKLLPPKDDILKAIEVQKEHLADITSYLWYILPIAERFGEDVYRVAAKSLVGSGIQVTAKDLKTIANELNTPEGKSKYAENRKIHIGTNLTSYKGV
ncbi:MAG: hypothetical protein MUO76_15395 [Anaerolineaceae bacterium]|nr:hypothetical protein [Anaerolineaceae bacterium]